jgi:hypothetical protein
MALRSTQPLTEMITRNVREGKGRLAHKADNLTAKCEPVIKKMWEPRRLTTLWARMSCYRDSFTFSPHLSGILHYMYRLIAFLTNTEQLNGICAMLRHKMLRFQNVLILDILWTLPPNVRHCNSW